jgi:Txe/YoeB family toxin of Txe-Axe toxin-antitoxin module
MHVQRDGNTAKQIQDKKQTKGTGKGYNQDKKTIRKINRMISETHRGSMKGKEMKELPGKGRTARKINTNRMIIGRTQHKPMQIQSKNKQKKRENTQRQ